MAVAAAGIGISVFSVLIYIISFGISITQYILTALSLYTIARRRQIATPWLAWLPVADNWTLGSIADDLDEQRGVKSKWRYVLLWISIIFIAAYFVFAIIFIALMFGVVQEAFYYEGLEESAIAALIIPAYLIILVLSFAGFAFSSLRTIAAYKVFESTVPEKALKYTLLYLLVPLAGPICLYKCRNSGYYKVITVPAAAPAPAVYQPQAVIPAQTPASPADNNQHIG